MAAGVYEGAFEIPVHFRTLKNLLFQRGKFMCACIRERCDATARMRGSFGVRIRSIPYFEVVWKSYA